MEWGRKSLEIDDQNEVRPPTVKLVLAMAAEREGRHEEALQLFAEASKPIREVIVEKAHPKLSTEVWWLDWTIAGALLEEAENLIGAPKSPPAN